MNGDPSLLQVVFGTLKTALFLGLPFMAVSLIVGFLAGVFQTGTSIQDQSISTVPRIFAVGLTLLILGPWVLNTILVLARSIFGNFAVLLGG